MPKFITSIRLQGANEKDYNILSQELKKYLFKPVTQNKVNLEEGLGSTFVFNSANNKTLLDTTAAVSLAASSTGKKYSFTVIKEKAKTEN